MRLTSGIHMLVCMSIHTLACEYNAFLSFEFVFFFFFWLHWVFVVVHRLCLVAV